MRPKTSPFIKPAFSHFAISPGLIRVIAEVLLHPRNFGKNPQIPAHFPQGNFSLSGTG
jgi:hypothetical protein